MVDKYKIVALFGPAGSGKDYIQKKMMQTIWGKFSLHEIISYTTRPPREGEKDKVDYHFITDEEFGKKDPSEWLETATFRGWSYGTSFDLLSEERINIGVFNVQGVKSLLENPKCDVLPVFIHTYDKLRLMRQLVREVNPDCYEICRRFQTDKEDFLNLPFSYKVIANHTDEIQPVLDDLFVAIRDWSKKDH